MFFLSDAHLGAQTADREQLKREQLFSFFEYVKTQKGDLVIVGDLFDFWFEYKTVIPRLHFHVLCKLSDLARYCRVHYVAGNHDFWLDHFIQDEIGLILHPDDFTLECCGFHMYVLHGDGIMKRDKGYRFLKRVLRNTWSIRMYRLLHPDLGIHMALKISRLSRNAGEPEAQYSDQDYRTFAELKIQQGFDIVVMGHTHIAALESRSSGWYVNPGDWMRGFSFAVVNQDGPALYQWQGNRAVSLNV